MYIVKELLDIYAHIFRWTLYNLKKTAPYAATFLILLVLVQMTVIQLHVRAIKSELSQLAAVRSMTESITRSDSTQYRKVANDADRLFKNIEFEETWLSEENRRQVVRLIDYADYSLLKNDTMYASRLYAEADSIQPTNAVSYRRARLFYIMNDLDSAAAELMHIKRQDMKNKYPEIYFYLAVLAYQANRSDLADLFLRSYMLAKSVTPTP